MELFLLLTFVGLVYFLTHFDINIFLPRQRVMKKLQRQGIKGPSPSFFRGNLPEMKKIQSKALMMSPNHGEFPAHHDYTSTIFPYFEYWRKEYGPVYTYSTGFRQHLCISDPELVRELNQSNTLDLGKPSYITEKYKAIFGNGVVRSNGHIWAQQRKIIVPEFFMDKIKPMVGLMMESTQAMLTRWEECIDSRGGSQAEIEIDKDLRELSADVISKACFGSSYIKGKEIFSNLRSLQQVLTKQSLLFRFKSFEFYPNKDGREMSNLKREIEALIWETVKERERRCLLDHNKDLLQLLIEEAVNNNNILGDVSPKSLIVDNCKTIYVSGHESTAITATWCLMLLALHPEWQSRIREEVAQCCNHGLLDANAISNFKTVNMVIQEALRLYPPSPFAVREALEDVQIGNLTIPKGVIIWTFIASLHRDPDNWGPDANEFRPERFAGGVSKACKFPQAYIPFGLGTRLCLGRNFAMLELKVVVSLIISKFTFSLSPSYLHSPTFRMLVEPSHGVQIMIRKGLDTS